MRGLCRWMRTGMLMAWPSLVPSHCILSQHELVMQAMISDGGNINSDRLRARLYHLPCPISKLIKSLSHCFWILFWSKYNQCKLDISGWGIVPEGLLSTYITIRLVSSSSLHFRMARLSSIWLRAQVILTQSRLCWIGAATPMSRTL